MTPPRFLRTAASIGAALLAIAGTGAPARGQTHLPPGFIDDLVEPGLDYPVGMALLPDGRLVFVEQNNARVRLLVDDHLASIDPVGTVPNVRLAGGEQGLLGIAVDPGWPARPYFYVHYDYSASATIQISRFTVTGDLTNTGDGSLSLDAASRYDVLTGVPDNASNHNGGTLRFGPDGMLYASFGEDASPCAAQDSVSLRGVILRLDISRLPPGPGGPAPKGLITPAGNPFIARPDSNERLVWELGLRNPFRFHIAPDGSLMIADVGQSKFEEIDYAGSPGLDFGWPLFEGPAPLSSCPGVTGAGMTGPIYSYDRQVQGTAAVISGDVYRPPICPAQLCDPRAGCPPCGFPAGYAGDYFFSDYYAGFLRRLDGSGSSWSLAPPEPGQPNATDWGTGFDEVSDYLSGPDGVLWYCRQAIDFNPGSGQIRRIVWVDTTSAPPASSAVSFAPPYPSPGRGYSTFHYTLASTSRVELRILDPRGRKIRLLVPATVQPPAAQGYDVIWDGRDDEGIRVPPGLYFAHLTVGNESFSRRVALLR